MLELLLGLLIGIVLGFVLGFCVAAWASVHGDRVAAEQGVVKLCGRIYRIEEIQ